MSTKIPLICPPPFCRSVIFGQVAMEDYSRAARTVKVGCRVLSEGNSRRNAIQRGRHSAAQA